MRMPYRHSAERRCRYADGAEFLPTTRFYNQAFEEYVFEHFREGEIFLLWQNDPAVIVGSYQNICREVHVERLRQLGIPVIRRITGGGTVYTRPWSTAGPR